MYYKSLETPPNKLVQNRKPVFGLFKGFPKSLDIRGVESPFKSIPLPRFISNFRIRGSLQFSFNIGPYIGIIDFLDEKIVGYAEVTFWNKENSRKYSYKVFMGPRRRFIPHNLTSGYCASYNKNRYIRISWDHTKDKISLILNLKGDSARPTVNAAFLANFSNSAMSELTAVVPAPTKRRCSATYFATPAIHGTMTLGATKMSEGVNMKDTFGNSLLSINRTYYTFLSDSEFVSATGMCDNHSITFQIFTTPDDGSDPELTNHNILFVDGECTPLPPVTITHPFGLNEKWVIQDFENMVDLTFTPVSENYRDLTMIVFHTQTHTVYGNFEGSITTKDGTTYNLSKFAGITRNQTIRI